MVHKFWVIDVTFPDGQTLKVNAESKGHETAEQVEQWMKERVYATATSIKVTPFTGEVSFSGHPLHKGTNNADHTPPREASIPPTQGPKRVTEPQLAVPAGAPIKPAAPAPLPPKV